MNTIPIEIVFQILDLSYPDISHLSAASRQLYTLCNDYCNYLFHRTITQLRKQRYNSKLNRQIRTLINISKVDIPAIYKYCCYASYCCLYKIHNYKHQIFVLSLLYRRKHRYVYKQQAIKYCECLGFDCNYIPKPNQIHIAIYNFPYPSMTNHTFCLCNREYHCMNFEFNLNCSLSQETIISLMYFSCRNNHYWFIRILLEKFEFIPENKGRSFINVCAACYSRSALEELAKHEQFDHEYILKSTK